MTLSSFYDLVYFSTATTGTGSITVGSAISGARTPAQASVPDGTVVSYSIIDGANFEVGQGTYTVSGTSLSRDTVTASSSSGSKINLSGAAVVSFTVLAQDLKSGEDELAQIVTASSQATVDFTSVSANYTTLRAIWSAQDTHTGTSIQLLSLKINNDGTSGNYTSTGRIGSTGGGGDAGLASPSSAGFAVVGVIPQAGNTSYNGSGEILLPQYSGTTFFKNIHGTYYSAVDSLRIALMGATYKSTSPISRLTFSTDGTAFKDGSVFTIYGKK